MRTYVVAKRLVIAAVCVIAIGAAPFAFPVVSPAMGYGLLGLIVVCWLLIVPLLLLGALFALTLGFVSARAEFHTRRSGDGSAAPAGNESRGRALGLAPPSGRMLVWVWAGITVLLTVLSYPFIARGLGVFPALLPSAAVAFLGVLLVRSGRSEDADIPGGARLGAWVSRALNVVVVVIIIAAPLAMLHANDLHRYRDVYLDLHSAKADLINGRLGTPAYRALACHRHVSAVDEIERGERVLSELRPPILPQPAIDDVAAALAQARIDAVIDYDPSACEEEARIFAERLSALGIDPSGYDWAGADADQLLDDVGTPFEEGGVEYGRHYPDRLSDWEVNVITLADSERQTDRAEVQSRRHAAEEEAAERLYYEQSLVDLRSSVEIALRSAPEAAEEVLEVSVSVDVTSQQHLTALAQAANDSNGIEALSAFADYVTGADRVLNDTR